MVQSTAIERGIGAPHLKDIKRPIDIAHLGRQALGDGGLALEVLRIFDDTSRDYLTRLETSTNVPDLIRHLHSINGAAAGIGAWSLRDLARSAENDLRGGAPVNPERIEDISMAVEEVSAFIAELVEADEE